MQNLSPGLFWDKFSDHLRERINLNPNWELSYISDKAWTPFIIKILKRFGQTLGYTEIGEIACEYYKIDMGYYKYASRDSKYIGCDWDFEVAIEHENNPKTWLEEFVKLIHINCGLKVIICYHDYQNLSDNMSLNSKLQVAKELYQRRKYKQQNDNWLIIIGPLRGKEGFTEDFIAYKMANGEFTPLDKKKIIK